MAPIAFATPSPSLATDFGFISSLTTEYLLEFCRAAVALLRGAAPMTKMYANAAKLLSVEAEAVENSVHALAFVMQRAAAISAPATRLLEGVDVALGDELLEALSTFYTDAQAELTQVRATPVGHSRWQGSLRAPVRARAR